MFKYKFGKGLYDNILSIFLIWPISFSIFLPKVYSHKQIRVVQLIFVNHWKILLIFLGTRPKKADSETISYCCLNINRKIFQPRPHSLFVTYIKFDIPKNPGWRWKFVYPKVPLSCFTNHDNISDYSSL